MSRFLSFFTLSKLCLVFEPRNGVVRYESVMMLRNKLDELGKKKGVNQDEKGGNIAIQSVL